MGQTFQYQNLLSGTDELNAEGSPHAWAPASGEVWP